MEDPPPPNQASELLQYAGDLLWSARDELVGLTPSIEVTFGGIAALNREKRKTLMEIHKYDEYSNGVISQSVQYVALRYKKEL